MSKAEQFGVRLGQSAAKYPRRTRVFCWAILLIVMALISLSLWQAFSSGQTLKLLIIGVIAGATGWRHYRKVSQTTAN
jgi:hypothetical protein